MKIMHICGGIPISNQSGIPNYVRNLATSQKESGHDVTVLTSNDGSTYNFNIYVYSSRIKSFSRGRVEDKKALDVLAKHLEKEQYDIIHVHMIMNIDWNLYDILKNYKYVVSLHDYWYLCARITMFWNGCSCGKYDEVTCKKCISYLEQFRICRGASKAIAKILGVQEFYPHVPQKNTKIRYEKYKLLLEGATYVLPVSNRVMEIYKNSGINARYYVSHIGNITADNFSYDYVFDKNDSQINMVFLGRLTKVKGVEVLLKIAENLDKNKYQIHFYGDSAAYADKIRKAGIIDHGKYQQVDLPQILMDMDLGLVLPVWEDNGPQVVMEMLNNHIPVVGTNMGGLTDLVVSKKNGYIFNPFTNEGYDELFQFLDELSIDQLKVMSENIMPTTTTREHLLDLDKIYSLCMNNDF